MDPVARRWVLAGGATLAVGGAVAIAHPGDRSRTARAPAAPTVSSHRTLAAERHGGNAPGPPELVRVARDGAVWALVGKGSHTKLMRLRNGLLQAVPWDGPALADLAIGARDRGPYLAYAAHQTVGYLLPDGRDGGHVDVPGDAVDVAIDRFGVIWYTDRRRAKIGFWDGRRLEERQVHGSPRARLDDITLGASSKLWFSDDRGRVGQADPIRHVLTLFDAPGGPPSGGPSRLAGAPVRGAYYTAVAGVGHVNEAGHAHLVAPALPSPPGAVVSGPDGNVWVAARRGSRLYRISPAGEIVSFALDLPADARLRDITRDPRRGALWIASARPRSLLMVKLPELRSKLR
jgi:streptogramin lyase